MYDEITFWGMQVPSYSFLILLGLMVVGIIGLFIAWRRNLDIKSFIKLGLAGSVMAVVGAKLLNMGEEAVLLFETNVNLKAFFNSGYSFYGGILLGLPTIYIYTKLLKVNFNMYASHLIFLIPLFHFFCKIGCFMAGCCYGIEYNGIGAVKTPEGACCFPIQLVEAIFLLFIALYLYTKGRRHMNYPVCMYLGIYTVIRFFAEFLRYHEKKYYLSTAQWISLIILCSILIFVYLKKKFSMRRR